MVPSPGELDEKYASSLILAHSLYYVKTMTSSTKPEVHNLLHCRQRRNDPQTGEICTKNWAKLGRVLFKKCSVQTDKHTDIQIR